MSMLKRGSRGPEVEQLQTELNRQLFPRPNLVVDGVFGALTAEAVRRFQQGQGLRVDGIVGNFTRLALGMPLPTTRMTHRVFLHFRSISLTDVSFNGILNHTMAVFAPHGIEIVFQSGMSLRLSPEEQARLSTIDGSCAWEPTDPDYVELLQLSATPGAGITVYLVDSFEGTTLGCGGHLPNRPACIVARRGSRYCTAHEIGHVLLGSTFRPVHMDRQRGNLMYPYDVERSLPSLTPAQVTAMKASRWCHAV